MVVNEKDTRVVRMYAADLAIGDVLLDPYGAYSGTVMSVPEVNERGYVSAQVKGKDDATAERRWRDANVMRIQIGRRTS